MAQRPGQLAGNLSVTTKQKHMKRLVSALLLTAAMYFTAGAQQQKPEWVTIKSANLKCWECKERLDKWLLKEKGITESGITNWKINLLQGEIKVQYLPNYITPDGIRVSLNNAGFDADAEKAEPDAYKKLPPSCKRAEDGGGPQKGKSCHVQPF
jgi:mercuric ion binding protein